MPLWDYDTPPQFPELDREYPPDSYITSTYRGWEIIMPNEGRQEILVAIANMDTKHDTSESNLELEDAMDFLLEDDSAGQAFFLLE